MLTPQEMAEIKSTVLLKAKNADDKLSRATSHLERLEGDVKFWQSESKRFENYAEFLEDVIRTITEVGLYNDQDANIEFLKIMERVCELAASRDKHSPLVDAMKRIDVIKREEESEDPSICPVCHIADCECEGDGTIRAH